MEKSNTNTQFKSQFALNNIVLARTLTTVVKINHYVNNIAYFNEQIYQKCRFGLYYLFKANTFTF